MRSDVDVRNYLYFWDARISHGRGDEDLSCAVNIQQSTRPNAPEKLVHSSGFHFSRRST